MADRFGIPAPVSERDLDLFTVENASRDRDRAAALGAGHDVADRVRGVDHEVQDDLIDLAEMARHDGARRETGLRGRRRTCTRCAPS
jgi:hypothetical protein